MLVVVPYWDTICKDPFYGIVIEVHPEEQDELSSFSSERTEAVVRF